MLPEDLGSLSRSSSTDDNTFSGSDAVSYQEHWKTSDDDSKTSDTIFQNLPQSTPGKSLICHLILKFSEQARHYIIHG